MPISPMLHRNTNGTASTTVQALFGMAGMRVQRPAGRLRLRRAACFALHKPGSVALALHALAQQLAVAPDRLGPFARAPLRRFFVIATKFHLPEHALALHFLFQGSQSLVDIVVANEDLHGRSSP